MQSEVSNENFDHFEEETKNESTKVSRKVDMKFVGYTYKADVEQQKNLLIQVLKDLGQESNNTSQAHSQYDSQQISADEEAHIVMQQRQPIQQKPQFQPSQKQVNNLVRNPPAKPPNQIVL